MLADEPAFTMRAKAGTFHLRILVTSAGDEQNPKDPGAVEARMIDNASELAERLAAVNPQSLVVERRFFRETHNSVGTVSLVAESDSHSRPSSVVGRRLKRAPKTSIFKEESWLRGGLNPHLWVMSPRNTRFGQCLRALPAYTASLT